jgi:hypothetical protein
VGVGNQRDTAVRAAALSATFILVQKAALELDIDPEEFDIVEPRLFRPRGGAPVPVLQITDHLINGAGFCARLASSAGDEPPLVTSLIKAIIENKDEYPLKDFLAKEGARDHPAECDQACYRCLHRYGNQMYHGLLDWRLGLAFLQLLLDPKFKCGLDGRFEGVPLSDWPRLCRGYAKDMVTFSRAGEVVEAGSLEAFRLDRSKPHWAIIVHPLWDTTSLPGVVGDAYASLDGPGARIEFVNTFDLARRQVTVREQLLQAWRS